jgi:hypothetical protein
MGMAAKRRAMPEKRSARDRTRPDARFPVAPQAGLPKDYASALAAIKSRIQKERLRVVLSADSAMALLYWDIGRTILDRQESVGWGAKVIDRLAADLRDAFPDMKGFSPASPTSPPRSSKIRTCSTSWAPPTRAASARSNRRSSIRSSDSCWKACGTLLNLRSADT